MLRCTKPNTRIIVTLESEAELAPKLADGSYSQITLPRDEAHHVKNVLRLKEGAFLEIISRDSHKKYEAVLQTLEPEVQVRILRLSSSTSSISKVNPLIFALCKGDTNEWVLEKACELAVSSIVIFQAEHSVVKLKSAEDAEKKLVRWNKICDAASKQSGNPNIPQIFFCKNLNEALLKADALGSSEQLKVCCSLSENTIDLNTLPTEPRNISLIIGPEGDLSKKEEESLKQQEYKFATLGPYTLRAETAAISAVSAINAIFGYN